MHRHNLDLIAEYAQGSLADESRARTLVETCTSCRAEFETQKALMAQLADVGTARLVDHEKAALHRDLWTELRNPTQRQSSRTRTWWPAWALGGATVIFVAVGALGVLNNQDSDVSENISEVGSALGGDDGSSVAVEPAASDSLESASETTLAMTEEAGSPSALSDSGAYESLASEVRSADSDSLYRFVDESTRLAISECLVEAGLGDFSAVTGFEELTDLIIAIPPEADINTASVAFVDPETCKIVHLEE